MREVAEVGLIVEGLTRVRGRGVGVAQMAGKLAGGDNVGAWCHRTTNRLGLGSGRAMSGGPASAMRGRGIKGARRGARVAGRGAPG